MMTISGFFFLRKHPVKVNFRNFKFSAQIVKDIYNVGLPAMVMQAIPSFVNVFLNMILLSFSEAAVSVLGVYFRIQSFVFMPVFGLNQGSTPIMGYNYGAKNRERLKMCIRDRHDFHLDEINVKFRANLFCKFFKAYINPIDQYLTAIFWTPNHMIFTRVDDIVIVSIFHIDIIQHREN